MKKVIYILLFSFIASLSISACTEEQIEPKQVLENGGGGASENGE